MNQIGHKTLCTFAVSIFLAFTYSPLHAQKPAPAPPAAYRMIVNEMEDSLRTIDDDIQVMQHFLEASTVDPKVLRNPALKSWRIQNTALRDSLFSVFVQVDSSTQSEAGADAIVLATQSNDLIEVRFGNAVMKGTALEQSLDRLGKKDLYALVASSYRYSRDIELRDPSVRLSTPVQAVLTTGSPLTEMFAPRLPEPHQAGVVGSAALSLTGLSVQTLPHWGAEIRLGFDDINLPFWMAGAASFLGSYDRVKAGVVLPFTGGRFSSQLFPPFVIRSRKLNGARGITASADFGTLGGSIAIMRLTQNDLSALTDSRDFYYLSGFASLYYSFGLNLDQTQSTRAKVGLTVRRIGHASLGDAAPDGQRQLLEFESETAASPYVSIEYINRNQGERFRAGLQFYDMTLTLRGSMTVIQDLLSIDAMYVWPLSPNIQPWQNPEIVMITPRLMFQF
jgi:hypothetical protein